MLKSAIPILVVLLVGTAFVFALFAPTTGATPNPPIPLLSSPGSVWWVGAASTDSSALPNTGVKGTIEVISTSVTGCLAFWVADDLSNNEWGQVGYYICDSSTPTGFYQIWNLNTNTELFTGTTSVTTGTHTFSMYLQSGTTWAYALDGNVFGTYDMCASVSSSTYPVYALSEEEASSTFNFPSVTFGTAMNVMRSSSWSAVGYAKSYGTSWGVEGNAQSSSILNNEIVVGGSIGTLAAGTALWGSQGPTTTTSSTSTVTLPPVTTIVTSTVTSTATSTATSTVTSTSTRTLPASTTTTTVTTTSPPRTTTTTQTSTQTSTVTSTVTGPATTSTTTVTSTSPPSTVTTTYTVTSASPTTVTQTATSTVTSIGGPTATSTTTVTQTSTEPGNTSTVTSTATTTQATATVTEISTVDQPTTVTSTTTSTSGWVLTTTQTETLPGTTVTLTSIPPQKTQTDTVTTTAASPPQSTQTVTTTATTTVCVATGNGTSVPCRSSDPAAAGPPMALIGEATLSLSAVGAGIAIFVIRRGLNAHGLARAD